MFTFVAVVILKAKWSDEDKPFTDCGFRCPAMNDPEVFSGDFGAGQAGPHHGSKIGSDHFACTTFRINVLHDESSWTNILRIY